MEPIRIVVPFDINRTSPNRRISRNPRLNKGAQTAEKNRSIEAARWAWKAAGKPKAPGAVLVTPIVRRQRVLEDDNAIAALKGIRDALFCGLRFADDGGAITPNDGNSWVRYGEIRWETGKRWEGREEVEFIVEEING